MFTPMEVTDERIIKEPASLMNTLNENVFNLNNNKVETMDGFDIRLNRAGKSIQQDGLNYFDWKLIFPELQVLKDNLEIIQKESEIIPQVAFQFHFLIIFKLNLTYYLLVGTLARRPFYSWERSRR